MSSIAKKYGSKVFSDDNIEYKLMTFSSFLNNSDNDNVNYIFDFIEKYPDKINYIKSAINLYSYNIIRSDRLTEEITINIIKHRSINFDKYSECEENINLKTILRKFKGNLNIINVIFENYEDVIHHIPYYICNINKEIAIYLIDNNIIDNYHDIIFRIIKQSKLYTPEELISIVDIFRLHGCKMKQYKRYYNNNLLLTYIRNSDNISLNVIKYICKYGKYKITKNILYKSLLSNCNNRLELVKFICSKLKANDNIIFGFIKEYCNSIGGNILYDELDIIINELSSFNVINNDNYNLLEYYLFYILNEVDRWKKCNIYENIAELFEDIEDMGIKETYDYFINKGLNVRYPELLERYKNINRL